MTTDTKRKVLLVGHCTVENRPVELVEGVGWCVPGTLERCGPHPSWRELSYGEIRDREREHAHDSTRRQRGPW